MSDILGYIVMGLFILISIWCLDPPQGDYRSGGYQPKPSPPGSKEPEPPHQKSAVSRE